MAPQLVLQCLRHLVQLMQQLLPLPVLQLAPQLMAQLSPLPSSHSAPDLGPDLGFAHLLALRSDLVERVPPCLDLGHDHSVDPVLGHDLCHADVLGQ